ncbi:MAG: DegV family EDD domain-containing protein [Acidobacteriia bacterium]|nr:DegV family EDD domain-containing protein [Terriglobia bacterium]
MAKLTILVADHEEARRRDLARGLASFGYEVIAAADAAEGHRFATGLKLDVVVTEPALSDGLGLPVPEEDAEGPLRILLTTEESGEVPETVVIPTVGLTSEAILRKLRTALVGRELGLGTDPQLTALEGDLQRLPALELLPTLQRSGVTGCVVLGGGDIALEGGEVVAARADGAQGVKAFVRIARAASGAFRVVIGSAGVPRELSLDLLSLMALALEDRPRYDEALARLPDLASRPRLVIGPAFFATQFSPGQQQVLAAVQGGGTIRKILDEVPEPDGSVLTEIAHLQELGFLVFDPAEINVRIVTDSTADLPPEIAARYGIQVVPLSVHLGGEILRDGIDLKPSEFFMRVRKSKGRWPETMPPTKAEFLAAYRAILARDDVVSLHLSSRLSRTFEHAREAADEGAEEFRRARSDGTPEIEVVDSTQVSSGLMLLAVLAARMARRRLSAKEIRLRIEAILPRVHALFVVDDLDFLSRSSRIKGTQALFGGLFGIKPILGIVKGEVVPVERIRGGANACTRIVELLRDRVDVDKPVLACIGQAAAPQLAARLRDLVREGFEVADLLENEIGPAVGAHVGPGCVGAAIVQPTDEELALIGPAASVV